MNAPAVLELPLDDALLKVLSSESRREILRLLRERRMTGAELAVRLDLGKPAVAEHLKKLQDAELIERFDDPERRWVYYSLSSRGRGILEPQRVRFYLVMAVAAVALMVGVAIGLGLVVLLQGHGMAQLGADPADSGGGIDGTLANPGPGNAIHVPANTTPSLAPAAPPVKSVPEQGPTVPALTSPELVAPSPSGEDPEEPAEEQSSGPLVLHATAGSKPAKKVFAYQTADLDLANDTVRLHVFVLDEATRRETDLGQAVDTAAEIPGIGILLRVPDDLELPTEVAATLSIPDLEAALAPPEEPAPTDAGDAPASPDVSSEVPASAAEDPPILPEPVGPGLEETPDEVEPVVETGGPPTTPAEDPILPVADAVASGAGTESAGGKGEAAASNVADQGGLVSATGSPRASIPLVALLAAAVMVSLYMPNRRQS